MNPLQNPMLLLSLASAAKPPPEADDFLDDAANQLRYLYADIGDITQREFWRKKAAELLEKNIHVPRIFP